MDVIASERACFESSIFTRLQSSWKSLAFVSAVTFAITLRNLTSGSRFFKARIKAGLVSSMLCSRTRSPKREGLSLLKAGVCRAEAFIGVTSDRTETIRVKEGVEYGLSVPLCSFDTKGQFEVPS
jgi:hypothetical protein